MPLFRWLVPVLLLVGLPVLPSRAATAPAPTVVHVPPAIAYRGFAVEFVARFPSPNGVTDPSVQWRVVGAKAFEKLVLVPAADGSYAATLEAAKVAGDLEYFVVGTDAKNPKSKFAWQSEKKPQKLAALTPPPHSLVTITTKPAGATVTIDGKLQGITPLSVTLFEGERKALLTLPDHVDETRTLTVTGSAPQTLSLVMKPKPARVVLDVVPADGELLIDGFPVGRGHAEGDLEAGKHRIAARQKGYEPQQDVVELRPGETLTKGFALVKVAAPVVEAPKVAAAPVVGKGPAPAGAAQPSASASASASTSTSAPVEPAFNAAAFAPPPAPPKAAAPMHWAVPWTWGALGLAVVAGGVGGFLAMPANDNVALVDGVRAHSITYKEAQAYNTRVAVAPWLLGASGALLVGGLGLVIVQSASDGSGGGIVVTGSFE